MWEKELIPELMRFLSLKIYLPEDRRDDIDKIVNLQGCCESAGLLSEGWSRR